MDKNAVLVSYNFLPIFKDLRDTGNTLAVTELIIAIVEYDKDNTEPSFTDPMVGFIWRTVVKPKLDEYKSKYNEKIRINRANGLKGGRPKKVVGLEKTEENQSVLEEPNASEKNSIDKNKNKNKNKIREDNNNNIVKPVKHKYGTYQNVLLSDVELEKLKQEFPLDWEDYIERVSSYCASHGKVYRDYLATIRNWSKSDKKAPQKNDIHSGLAMAFDLIQRSET